MELHSLNYFPRWRPDRHEPEARRQSGRDQAGVHGDHGGQQEQSDKIELDFLLTENIEIFNLSQSMEEKQGVQIQLEEQIEAIWADIHAQVKLNHVYLPYPCA